MSTEQCKTKQKETQEEQQKELISMATLAKPVNRAFELSPSKATKFFEDSKKGTSQKVIDRANKYITDKKSK